MKILPVKERPAWVPAGKQCAVLETPSGERIFALQSWHKPDGPAASIYGVRCLLQAVHAGGEPMTRASGKPIEYDATTSGDKVSDPEALVELAQRLRDQAFELAANGLLEEIAVERANARLGIG